MKSLVSPLLALAALAAAFAGPAIAADPLTDIPANIRDRVYPALVANRVLDEGVDVPEVKVAAVLGGTASIRQAKQRLGQYRLAVEFRNRAWMESQSDQEGTLARLARPAVVDGARGHEPQEIRRGEARSNRHVSCPPSRPPRSGRPRGSRRAR